MKRKLLAKSLLLLCALIVGMSSAWAQTADVTYDFTGSDWTVSNGVLSNGIVSFNGAGGANFKMNGGYFMMGKKDAYINFPTYSSPVKKIVVTGRTGASASVGQNIFVSGTAVSTATTGAEGANTYEIASAYQAAGTQYTLKVTSAHNTQITKIEIFYAASTPSNIWTVTYNGNGATSGDVPTDATEYSATNNTVTVLGNTGNLAKTGHTFAGWNTDADGNGDDYDADDTFTISANTTLYAQWTANSYTVTLPTDDTYGSYTMDADNPVAYGTEVTLTYTHASGYENYQATWSVNGDAIAGNKFTMPAEAVTVTVSVAEVVDYATLPFIYDGTGNSDDLVNGLTQHGITKSYSSSPKIQFDGTGDYLILKVNERPGTLAFKIKGNSFSDGTFKVQTSEDGHTYTDLATYTDLTTTIQNESFNNLGENVRYIKWVYTNKVQGNVALGNINLTAYVAPANYDLTVTLSDNINAIFVFDTTDENNPLIEDGAAGIVQVINGTEILVSPVVEDGYQLASLMVDDVDVTSQIDEGAYIFTMPDHNVTITATAVTPTPSTGVKYVKVTSTDNLTDGLYLIVCEEKGVAFDGSLTTLDAASNTISVTINNDEIAATDETTAAEFTIDVAQGTIQNASGYYIGQTSDANGLQASDVTAYENSFNFTGENADITSEGGVYLRYNANSGQNRFRYFKSTTYGGQKAIQLYKKVETVTVTDAGWATFAPTQNVSFDSQVMSAYVVTNATTTSATLQPVSSVPANTPVLICATEGTYDLPVVDAATAPTTNLLQVSDGNVTGGDYIYCLANDEVDGVGFYRVDPSVIIPEGKCYLEIQGVQARSFLSLGNNNETGITTVAADAIDGNIYDLTGRRVSGVARGLYIVNGKKVVLK